MRLPISIVLILALLSQWVLGCASTQHTFVASESQAGVVEEPESNGTDDVKVATQNGDSVQVSTGPSIRRIVSWVAMTYGFLGALLNYSGLSNGLGALGGSRTASNQELMTSGTIGLAIGIVGVYLWATEPAPVVKETKPSSLGSIDSPKSEPGQAILGQ